MTRPDTLPAMTIAIERERRFRVVIAYQTKRESIALGMTVSAFDEDEAIEKAKSKALKGYPARKLAYVTVESA